MNAMILYTKEVLLAIASFMAAEPIIYLFGLICACFVVKFILLLVGRR